MQDFSHFVAGNWELFLALAIVLVLLARTWFGPGAVDVLLPMEAVQLINHKNAVLVDVRTDKEYGEGHIMNTLHIPLGVLENRIQELQAYKNNPLIMVCRSGARSGQAAAKLKKQGFEDVHNLGGGMLAWERANLPVTTAAGKPPKPLKAVPVAETVDADDTAAHAHEVIVYSTRKCPFCTRAIDLLEAKHVGFTEIRIDIETERRAEMETRAGRTSVPQIFIGDVHVGGCDDMYELEAQGKLDALLGLSDKPSGDDQPQDSAA